MADSKLFSILHDFLGDISSVSCRPNAPNGLSKFKVKPFFSALSVKCLDELTIVASFGGTIKRSFSDPSICGRVDMRMGNAVNGGGAGSDYFDLPLTLERDACMLSMVEAANRAFWDCAEDYTKRFSEAIGMNDAHEKYLYFCKAPVIKFQEDEKKIVYDPKDMEAILKRISRSLNRKDLNDSRATFMAKREARYYVNSEGSSIFTNYVRYSITLEFNARDERGFILPYLVPFYTIDPSKLPSESELIAKGEEGIKNLLDIVKAPIQINGAYPMIMDGDNTGVVCHEVIGHALEGHRMQENTSDDGLISTFDGRIGDKIAPEFVTLRDNPAIKGFDGSYEYDEEGVKSRDVVLIENGILRNYLHSRQSAGFFRTSSNGHSRSNQCEYPTPRMSNLFFDSSNMVSYGELEDNLLRMINDQKRSYGLIMEGTEGGITLPKESFFNTFPKNIFQIDRKGDKKRVKGVYIVGTPHQVLSDIVQTSDRYVTSAGTCGAESGWIPATETAPDALVKSVEINRIPKESFTSLKNPVISRDKYFRR